MISIWNIASISHLIFQVIRVVLLKIQAFWDVTLCCCACSSRHLKMLVASSSSGPSTLLRVPDVINHSPNDTVPLQSQALNILKYRPGISLWELRKGMKMLTTTGRLAETPSPRYKWKEITHVLALHSVCGYISY
jgi:ABC-type arginine transport system ATPase subunit